MNVVMHARLSWGPQNFFWTTTSALKCFLGRPDAGDHGPQGTQRHPGPGLRRAADHEGRRDCGQEHRVQEQVPEHGRAARATGMYAPTYVDIGVLSLLAVRGSPTSSSCYLAACVCLLCWLCMARPRHRAVAWRRVYALSVGCAWFAHVIGLLPGVYMRLWTRAALEGERERGRENRDTEEEKVKRETPPANKQPALLMSRRTSCPQGEDTFSTCYLLAVCVASLSFFFGTLGATAGLGEMETWRGGTAVHSGVPARSMCPHRLSVRVHSAFLHLTHGTTQHPFYKTTARRLYRSRFRRRFGASNENRAV